MMKKLFLLMALCTTTSLYGCDMDGEDGMDGEEGLAGEDGSEGEPGSDGEDGADGEDGMDGADGEDGADGTDGEDGADVVSFAGCTEEDIDSYNFSACTKLDVNVLSWVTCTAGGTMRVLVDQDGEPTNITFDVRCTADDDHDGMSDATDNCVEDFNPFQGDDDLDGTGDVCDDDMDGDGILNDFDRCETEPGLPVHDICNEYESGPCGFGGWVCDYNSSIEEVEDCFHELEQTSVELDQTCVDTEDVVHLWTRVDCGSPNHDTDQRHGCPAPVSPE